MSYVPCRERTFGLRLADEFEYHYWHYLHWLKHLLERLGREPTLALWADAFQAYDQGLLQRILSAGWEEVDNDEAEEIEGSLSGILDDLFSLPVEDVTMGEAQTVLENTPPFRQIRKRFPSLKMERQTTTYEALHLFRDALALLAEALIDRYGKQGEFLIYDALLEEWPRSQEPRMSVEEYLSRRLVRFSSEPDEPSMFTAGLEVEVVRGSEKEVVTRVTACEWARYYRERHPRVGYLLGCSLDNAAYRSFNDRLRLQRTTTLMEGGTECDFRVYAVEEISA